MELLLCPTSPASAEYYQSKVLEDENVGFDLFVPRTVQFAPGERKFVSMEVKAVVLEGKEAQHYWMLPRSSMSKTGLMLLNSVGVIDKSYRGELIAALWNTTEKEVVVEQGQRLVQLVSRTMESFQTSKVVQQLDSTERGEGGFGSTGK
jgi:dUTP pyrophosphatase